MRTITRVICAGLLVSAALLAQPVVNSVLNPASYALPGMPGYGIAQGGLFVAFGTNLGPSGLKQATSFPLPKNLNGISIKATVGGVTVDCIIMNSYGAGATPATQVVGLLPSTTPIGTGTLVLTYNNVPSAAASLKVVKRAFGITAVNAGGSGPAVVTDANYSIRLITQSATSGQALILWGTGLGAITGDETQPAPFRDMVEADVKVYVGGKLATVLFRGRSPGAAGLDQINFNVPAGLSGCYVPIVVIVDGIASNWTTLPVAATNGACSDPYGFSAQDIQAAWSRGSLKTGTVSLLRTTTTITVPIFGSFTTSTDTGSAEFSRYDASGLISFQGTTGGQYIGACTVFQFSGDTPAAVDPVSVTGLDAGASLSVSGPKGVKAIPAVAGSKGSYSATLGGGGNPITGGGLPDYLDAAGNYTVTGTGGADVGGFTTTLTIPAVFTWANKDSISSVTRSQDLTVTWTGGAASTYTLIMGYSGYSTPLTAGALFLCVSPSSTGTFTVPSYVLSALPVSEVQSGVPTGMLLMGSITQPVSFTATGIDTGSISSQVAIGKMLQYQ